MEVFNIKKLYEAVGMDREEFADKMVEIEKDLIKLVTKTDDLIEIAKEFESFIELSNPKEVLLKSLAVVTQLRDFYFEKIDPDKQRVTHCESVRFLALQYLIKR